MTLYRNPVFDCDGARLRVQSRQLATIIFVSGEISKVNIDRVVEHAHRYMLADEPVVLDLSGVTQMDTSGLALLYAVDHDCGAGGHDWFVIPSTSVMDVLRGTDDSYPIAGSVPEALNCIADETSRRRTVLLPLLTKSPLTKSA